MNPIEFPLAESDGTRGAVPIFVPGLAQYPGGTFVEESAIEAGMILGVQEMDGNPPSGVDGTVYETPCIIDGMIYIRNSGLTGVSVVERAGMPTITADKTLEMPLASDKSSVEAVGLMSAVEVVAPYGVDAGSVRKATLENGTLRIPRAHSVYSVDEQTTGLIAGIREHDAGVSGVEIRDGIIYIPKSSGAAGVQQVSNGTMSFVEPTIEGSTLFLPFAATSSVDGPVDGEANPRVGLLSWVEYHSAVEIPEIHNGTIRLPLPRGTKGIAYGAEDATGYKSNTAAWSAVEGSYVDAASCSWYLGPTIGSIFLTLQIRTQDGFLNMRFNASY